MQCSAARGLARKATCIRRTCCTGHFSRSVVCRAHVPACSQWPRVSIATQEFRCLTNQHANKADKLQIKNVIYHSMNGCIDYLSRHEGSHQSATA
jgi:hypothetical protein